MKQLMSRILLVTSLVLAASFIIPSIAVAKPPRARVKARQFKEVRRLHHGVKQGQITRGEARHLKRQQRRINRNKRRMIKNDGRLDRRERRVLRRQQRRANRNIWRARHNRRHR